MNAHKPKGDDEAELAVKEAPPDVKEPPKYAVVLHNDDFTTMELVIEVLRKFFKKNTEQAHKIMLEVHHSGQGIAGIYSFEIAETKAVQATDYARSKGYPLKLTTEPLKE